MNEHIKELTERLTEAINEIPHQQVSPETLRLIVTASQALTVLKIKFDK